MHEFDPLTGGLMLVDKPTDWTSFDVVNKLRQALRSVLGYKVKAGHAGTLDPLASGLLVLGIGKATKELPLLTEHDKTYIATLRLGETTPSYDAETEVAERLPWEHLTEADLRAAFVRFVGDLSQRPPNFSAKRHEGERAYHLAREGKSFELPVRAVRIDRIELLGIDGPEVRIAVDCSKGTYIRSLAHDVGAALGCGAHLSALRRMRSGAFDVADARTPEQWSAWLAEWAIAHPLTSR